MSSGSPGKCSRPRPHAVTRQGARKVLYHALSLHVMLCVIEGTPFSVLRYHHNIIMSSVMGLVFIFQVGSANEQPNIDRTHLENETSRWMAPYFWCCNLCNYQFELCERSVCKHAYMYFSNVCDCVYMCVRQVEFYIYTLFYLDIIRCNVTRTIFYFRLSPFI